MFSNKLFNLLVIKSIENAKAVFWITALVTIALCVSIPTVKVDVDPENMLSEFEPARIFHNTMKERMDLRDLIILGITRDDHTHGVFNPDSLKRVNELSKYIRSIDGVVHYNLLSPDHVDAIEPEGKGVVRFERLMKVAPVNQEDALRVRDRASNNPFLTGTLLSDDKKSLTLFIPITAKDKSWRIANLIEAKFESLGGPEKYHITGLPVAEDTFGVEMFIQMAISAPLAMLCIAFLMWLFFRNIQLVLSGMAIAMISVMVTMGAFITSGQTLHIMSSMIPIFIMPIAVLDAVHVLSQFHDEYDGDRKNALIKVMKDLWPPMLYTTLTTAAGFISLSLSSIPPVQVFGVFTGLGIIVAWLVTMTFLPAFISVMSEEKLQGFGSTGGKSSKAHTVISSFVFGAWRTPYRVLLVSIALSVLAVIGISKIEVNDNPMKWFETEHPIRKADNLINTYFGGSYITYLSFSPLFSINELQSVLDNLILKIDGEDLDPNTSKRLVNYVSEVAVTTKSPVEFLNLTRTWIDSQIEIFQSNNIHNNDLDEPGFELQDELVAVNETQKLNAWIELDNIVADIQSQYQIFKNPEMLKWLDNLLNHIVSTGLVSRGNTAADLVKKINKELHEGDINYYSIPDTAHKVAETYITYQNSHDPQRLWHLVTHDFATTTLWLQLRSGDNKDVNLAVQEVNKWVDQNPPVYDLEHQWFGLSYINVLWQEKMVNGMLYSLISSALVVFLLMFLLFRSLVWAAISLIPLATAMAAIYGTIGLIGQDYDMPVAVLSALALGLAIDFSIHFIIHFRNFAMDNSVRDALKMVMGPPGRGIMRNAIIVAIGFTPLLLAPLIPYQTVGILMASILVTSAMATFFILPAILSISQTVFFPQYANSNAESTSI